MSIAAEPVLQDRMELVSMEANPVPPNPVVVRVQTPDRFHLRLARWRTLEPPSKGTVIVLQGRGEYIEKYFETISDLRRTGYDVCAFDWRGQGGSTRFLRDTRKGYVDSFEQYLTDFEAVMEQVVLPDCRPPYFVLAHSFGALVALLSAPAMANRIQRMVLSAPLLRFGDMRISEGRIKVAAGLLTTFGLGSLYLGPGAKLHERRRFADNPLTSDMRRFDRNHAFATAHPELAIAGPTAAWLFAATRAMGRLNDPDFVGSITIPTLMIAGGNDKVVSVRAIEELGWRMRSGRTLVIPAGRHELLQEVDLVREQFLAALRAFVPGEQRA